MSFLDNKNVIFGRVINGLRTFKLIEKLDCVNEKPKTISKIVKAGIYIVEKPVDEKQVQKEKE